MKKKTYVLDDGTLDIIDKLKEELNQKEVSIIKYALKNLYELHCEKKRDSELLKEIIIKLNYAISRIEDLSIQLGRCQERCRLLEEKLKELSEI